MKNAIAFIVGLIFALGLGISGMTQPHIVKGFLDLTGEWNPSLMGVMVGAIVVHAILFRFIRKRPSPILEPEFHLPVKQQIDTRLIVGAAIFGVGWGWGGICPGPGLTDLASGELAIVYFVVFMLMGMKVVQLMDKK
jgi:uncharacterized membrane protein YedE/YeeE